MGGRFAYGWITLGFFAVSIVLHWWLGWYAFAQDAAEHGQSPQLAEYLIVAGRDTFENWQSEFLQLLWQVVGLAYFLYVGSPASKENDDRLEVKVDALIRMVGGDKADKLLADIDHTFLRTHGIHPHGHEEDLTKNAGKGLGPNKTSSGGNRGK